MQIAPFAPEHLDAAAALLAARHRDDRTREPDLPVRFAAPEATRALLERMLRRQEATGVVALRRGRMVGYLIGYSIRTLPTNPGAAFIAARAGYIAYPGYAVHAEDATDVQAALYGALATGWVKAGCLSHYVQVAPTDTRSEERWHALGFGRESVTAIRDTDGPSVAGGPVNIRRAKPEDLDTVMAFIKGLHHFLTAAPMWRPHLPETEAEERTLQRQMLEDPACSHWIASEDGQPLGMQSFQPPPLYQRAALSQLLVPDRSVNLPHAFTEPAARGRRIGTNLLASGMAWAREAGHTRCLVEFTAANLLGARFWLGHGFRPIAYRLCQRLDERIISADRAEP